MKKNQRGDTLVEVLIAITVLGIIVAGVMATMNRSLVSILNSAERTAARTDINTQTDLLNYVYRNDKETWSKIVSIAWPVNAGDTAPSSAKDTCKLNTGSESGSHPPKYGSFYLETEYDDDGGISDVVLHENLTDENGKNEFQRAIIGKGVWVDAVYYKQGNGNQRSYIDFYIKACWVPFGGNTSPTTDTQSVTVARIYDYMLDNNSYTPPPPPVSPAPIVGRTLSGNTITFSWQPPTSFTCPSSSIQYQYRQNSGSWILTSNTSFAWTVSASGSYTLQVQVRCGSSDSWGSIGSNTYTTPAAPAAPTVSSTPPSGSSPLTFTWTATTCPTDTTAQYQYRKDGGAWASPTTSTSYSWTSATPFGSDYLLEVQARCSDFGAWSNTGSKTHSRPSDLATNAALTITNTNAANSISWKLSGVSCTKGSIQYRYRLKAGTGSFSAWVTTTGTTVNQTTSGALGFIYYIEAQARCYVGSDYSTWRPDIAAAKDVAVIPQGDYTIRYAASTNLALAIPGASLNATRMETQEFVTNTNAQMWLVAPISGTAYYRIRTKIDTNYYLYGSGPKVVTYDEDSCSQKWEFSLISGETDIFGIITSSCTSAKNAINRLNSISASTGNYIVDVITMLASPPNFMTAQKWKLVSV